MKEVMKRAIVGAAIIGIAGGFASASRVDEEPIQCGTVALAVAESGQAGPTAAASVLLKALGYKTEVHAADAAAVRDSMKSGDVDVLLGQQGADVRSGYLDECKNVGKLLKNIRFPDDSATSIGESEDDARGWLKSNQGTVDSWLKGVKAWDGKTDGRKAVRKAL